MQVCCHFFYVIDVCIHLTDFWDSEMSFYLERVALINFGIANFPHGPLYNNMETKLFIPFIGQLL